MSVGTSRRKKEWQMNGSTEFVISLDCYEAAFRNREDYSDWHLTCDFVKIDTPTLGLYYENYWVI
jgi:hypothetical protein